MTVTIYGREGITAKIVQDSIANGKRIITFELDYPRFIHSELMTHRVFSRNAASSRAVPVEKMHQHIKDNPAQPVYWGKNQAGMSAKEEITGKSLSISLCLWDAAKDAAIMYAKDLLSEGVHKQIANRVTEPFQMMKTIVTTTETSNWFELRNHEDAQPEIHELAICMSMGMLQSEPLVLAPGQWHVPYISRSITNGAILYNDNNGHLLTTDEAIMISASCCAQVSYRKSDDTLEKAKAVFDRLINSKPVHASPVEHQATPQATPKTFPNKVEEWEKGVTHMRKDGSLWSNNFNGWIQYRALLT